MGKKKSFQDLLNPEPLRWPGQGDRLLRSTEDWDRGVEFSHDETARHVHMEAVNGFFDGADGQLSDYTSAMDW